MTNRMATLLAMAVAITAVTSTMGAKPVPRFVWNASESVPIGLYSVQPAGKLAVTNLVVAMPPEPLATFLAERDYLPIGTPLIKRILALPGHSVCRAIAAYRGSWDRPDAGFADAVRRTVEKGNAPNFDMPKDAYFDPNDVTLETVTPCPHPALTAPAMTSDDRKRGWSSALFPAEPAEPDSTSVGVQKPGRPAEESRSPGRASPTPRTSKTPADSLFVPRSSERRP